MQCPWLNSLPTGAVYLAAFSLSPFKKETTETKKMTEVSASVASDWLWPSQSLSD